MEPKIKKQYKMYRKKVEECLKNNEFIGEFTLYKDKKIGGNICLHFVKGLIDEDKIIIIKKTIAELLLNRNLTTPEAIDWSKLK